jgi:hypothetical protein
VLQKSVNHGWDQVYCDRNVSHSYGIDENNVSHSYGIDENNISHSYGIDKNNVSHMHFEMNAYQIHHFNFGTYGNIYESIQMYTL